MSDSPDNSRNVVALPLSPEAQAILNQALAAKVKLDEFAIHHLQQDVSLVVKGETDWQRDVSETLATVLRLVTQLTDEIHTLRLARIVWPSLVALTVFFLGGFAGVIVLHMLLRG